MTSGNTRSQSILRRVTEALRRHHEVINSKEVVNVFVLAQVHGQAYNGPSMNSEETVTLLKDAEAALALEPEPGSPPIVSYEIEFTKDGRVYLYLRAMDTREMKQQHWPARDPELMDQVLGLMMDEIGSSKIPIRVVPAPKDEETAQAGTGTNTGKRGAP